MPDMRHALLALLFVLAAPAVHAQSRARLDVPIVIGGDTRLDACGGSGQIVGLDPNGDGFLSVRSGPGGRPFREIDRLFNGNLVYICEERGPWVAVVYPVEAGAACMPRGRSGKPIPGRAAPAGSIAATCGPTRARRCLGC